MNNIIRGALLFFFGVAVSASPTAAMEPTANPYEAFDASQLRPLAIPEFGPYSGPDSKLSREGLSISHSQLSHSASFFSMFPHWESLSASMERYSQLSARGYKENPEVGWYSEGKEQRMRMYSKRPIDPDDERTFIDGPRPDNEDVCGVIYPKGRQNQRMKIYAYVFDGHGCPRSDGKANDAVAKYLEHYFLEVLQGQPLLMTDTGKAIKEAFVAIDRIFSQPNFLHQGATGTIVMVIDGMVIVAHVGDSRCCVVKRDGTPIATKDHKSSDTEERKFIEEQGGRVAFGRCGGILAVSRAFGDFSEVSEDNVNVVQKLPGLSCTPSIYTVPLADCALIIVASDGMWDCEGDFASPGGYLASKILSEMEAHKSTVALNGIAEKIVQERQHKHDDASLVLISFLER